MVNLVVYLASFVPPELRTLSPAPGQHPVTPAPHSYPPRKSPHTPAEPSFAPQAYNSTSPVQKGRENGVRREMPPSCGPPTCTVDRTIFELWLGGL